MRLQSNVPATLRRSAKPRMMKAITLLLLGLLPLATAFPGTNAAALRRPRSHRHYHEAAGSSPSVHEPVSLSQAIATARQYKAKPIMTPIVKRMSESQFMTSFDVCVCQRLLRRRHLCCSVLAVTWPQPLPPLSLQPFTAVFSTVLVAV